MGYRKPYKALIVLFLFVGFTLNCLLAEVCFCGQSCWHGLQPKAKARAGFPFHMRCPDTLCTSCNIEDGQNIIGSKHSIPSIDLKTIGLIFFVCTIFNYQVFSSILIFSGVLFSCLKPLSFPIYLQKLSLRF